MKVQTNIFKTALAALLLSLGVAKAQIVTNGSFEDPGLLTGIANVQTELGGAIAGGSVVTGWRFTDSIRTHRSDTGTIFPDGSIAFYFGPAGGKLQQEGIELTLPRYRFSFTTFGNGALDGELEFSIGRSGERPILTTQVREDGSDGVATNHSFEFDVRSRASDYMVEFGHSSGAIYLDNVQIVAVPEPSSALLAGVGFLTLLCRRRR